MLITATELVQSIRELSAVQLAYLVKTRAIDRPITFPCEPPEFLFDSEHQQQIRALLGLLEEKTSEHCSGDADRSGTSSPEAYSKGARDLLKRHSITSGPNIPERELEELFGSARPIWYKRAWSYLTTFKLFKVKLTGDEQLELVAHTAVATAKLHSLIVATVAPRLRRFDPLSSFDRCLQAYVRNYEHIGWGRFKDELDLMEVFFREDSELPSLHTKRALEQIFNIESAYMQLSEDVFRYLADADPEKLIAMRLSMDSIGPRFREIFQRSYGRAEQNFLTILSDAKNLKEGVDNTVVEQIRKKL